MSLIYNATFDKNTRKLSFEDRAGNEIYSFTVPERAPAVDDITKPLTFKATQDGSSVTLTSMGSPSGAFQTSRDGGNTWVDYTPGASITLNTGDEVSFRAKSDRSPQTPRDYFYFSMKGKIEAWHNVMSLYRTNDFATYNTTPGTDTFNSLFRDCTSLTKAPALPATTITDSCYYGMFRGCQSLTKAPELPATTLDIYCYGSMFSGCQSLTKAPELPATTLSSSCYRSMFSGCQSLTKAPELPATRLAEFCYNNMFYGCSKLKEVRVSATTTATDALYNWLSYVSATGDFYCDPNATIFPTDSASGIPKGWTRVNVDNITKPLTFRATQDGSTVKLTKKGSPTGSFQTSRDGGNTWADYTIDTVITLNTGNEVSFRAKADRTSAQNIHNCFNFEMTGKIEAWHNAMSMIRTSDFATYESMVESGLRELFRGCKSLTKAPALPATTLARDCYEQMFYDCQSLKEAPELPATTLVYGCYSYMFWGCDSLTKAPALPATTLADYCYYIMFSGCRSLKEVRIAATTTATLALESWLGGVSATGDFYCDPNATIFPSGSSGIPQNWTRHALSDYPNP